MSAVKILLGLLQITLNLHQASYFWTLGLIIYLIDSKLSGILITLIISHFVLLLLSVLKLFYTVPEPSDILS